MSYDDTDDFDDDLDHVLEDFDGDQDAGREGTKSEEKQAARRKQQESREGRVRAAESPR